MSTLCEKAKVSYFRFHKLRHSGASIMDSNSVPLGAIQKILGHESRRTTEIYLHTLGKMERDAMAVYERATKNSHTDSHTAPLKKEGALRSNNGKGPMSCWRSAPCEIISSVRHCHVVEVAEYFAISVRTVYPFIDEGELNRTKIRGCLRVPLGEIRRYERELEKEMGER